MSDSCFTCDVLQDKLLSASIRFFDLQGKRNVAALLHDDDSAIALNEEMEACAREREHLKETRAAHEAQAHPKQIAAVHGGSI